MIRAHLNMLIKENKKRLQREGKKEREVNRERERGKKS